MTDEEIIEALRNGSRTRVPHQLVDLLEELRAEPITQGAMVTFLKRAFPAVPLRVLLEAGAWHRVSGGGMSDAAFDALLRPFLAGGEFAVRTFGEFVEAHGLLLRDLGLSEFALQRDDALTAVSLAESEGICVLGGDVYIANQGRIETAYANWHVERREGESSVLLAKRSCDVSKAYISRFDVTLGVGLFVLVTESVGPRGRVLRGTMAPKSRVDVQGFEFDWLGSDCAGCVALFSTAGAGYAPAQFLRDTDAHDAAIRALLALPATTQARFAPVLGSEVINTWRLVAERGLYAYDCDPNGGPYRLVASPVVAAIIRSLPASVAELAAQVRCGVPFDQHVVVSEAMLRS